MLIRSALDSDIDSIADVYLRAWRIAMPFVRNAHGDEEVRAWIRRSGKNAPAIGVLGRT